MDVHNIDARERRPQPVAGNLQDCLPLPENSSKILDLSQSDSLLGGKFLSEYENNVYSIVLRYANIVAFW